MFKFCYDYIRWQKIDISKIPESKDAYDKMKLYDENAGRSDEDLQKIYSYYDRTEIEVRDTLKSIEERLHDPKEVGFYSYGKLAAYLVMISHVIGFDYTQCKKCMIQNIMGKGDSISSDLLFLPMYDLKEEEKKELDDFFEELSKAMNTRQSQDDFSYNPDEIENIYIRIVKEKNKISRNHEFLSKYNVNQIVEMLFRSSAKQIGDFRGILLAIYKYAGKTDYIEADVKAMNEILELVQEKLNSSNYDIDKIQVMQLNLLCSNLRTFILQMS